MTKSKRSLWGHGATLMLCSFFAKAIGALYRLPLTNLLGAEGIGRYQLVFPLYALTLALTSSAMPVLLARQIAKEQQFGYAVFRRSLTLMALLGGGGAALLLAAAYPVAYLQGASQLSLCYVVVAPAVLAVALSSAFRGWMAATMHTGVLAGATLAEQVVKLSGLGFAVWFAKWGNVPAVLGALLGVSLAEIATLGWHLIAYFALGYRLPKPVVNLRLRPIWSSSLPITACNMIMPVVAGVDSLLLVNLSVWGGMGRALAVNRYGLLTGAVGTVTNLPIVLTLAFVTLIVPIVSRAVAVRRIQEVRRHSTDVVWLVAALSLPASVGLLLMAPSVVGLLYPRLSADEQAFAVVLLRISAVSVPVIALQQVYNALLQAVERSVTGAKQMAVGGAVKLVLDVVLVPFLGMTGAAGASVACYAVVLTLHVLSYTRLTGRYALAKPLAASMFAALCMGATVWALSRIVENNTLSVVLNVLIGGAVYAIILWCVHGATWWHDRRASGRNV